MDFAKFFKLKTSQSFSSLSAPMYLHLLSILKSPFRIMFSYFSKALLKTVLISSKNVVNLEYSGGRFRDN